jgi:hypothetical protein
MSALRIFISSAPALMLVGALSADAPDPVASRQQADSLKRKIAAIAERSEDSQVTARTTVTEPEVNGYLALETRDELPTGVVSPTLTLLGGGRATGQAVVDLDRVRRGIGATSMLNPLSYLRGQLPVAATGALQTRDGVARLQLESATVGGVPVPKIVLQQIVSYYSRSERFPSGIDLDEPFTLPARIREIQIDRGQATIVQ